MTDNKSQQVLLERRLRGALVYGAQVQAGKLQLEAETAAGELLTLTVSLDVGPIGGYADENEYPFMVFHSSLAPLMSSSGSPDVDFKGREFETQR